MPSKQNFSVFILSKYKRHTQTAINSKCCVSVTANVPLFECVTAFTFLTPFNFALQTPNYIFRSFSVRSKHNNCQFAKGSSVVVLKPCRTYERQLVCCKMCPLFCSKCPSFYYRFPKMSQCPHQMLQ
jgi:hypothetical protein